MEPSGNSPLSAEEIGLLYMADHAIVVALDEDPTPGQWWFRLLAKPRFDTASFVIPVALVAAFLIFDVRSWVSAFVEHNPHLHALDHLIPVPLGRIGTIIVYALVLSVIEIVRKRWDGTLNPLHW